MRPSQELGLHLVPLLAALQHCTLLMHLDIRWCSLTRLPEGCGYISSNEQ